MSSEGEFIVHELTANRYSIRRLLQNDVPTVNALAKTNTSHTTTSSGDGLGSGAGWLVKGIVQAVARLGGSVKRDVWVAERGTELSGVALAVPERPIKRCVLWLCVTAQLDAELECISALVAKSREVSLILGLRKIHVEIDSASDSLGKALETLGFRAVRTYVEMWCPPQPRLKTGLGIEPKPQLPTGVTIREMQFPDEIPEWTALQNIVFMPSFGFAANTVEQNQDKLQNGERRNRVFFVVSDDDDGRIQGYCWVSSPRRGSGDSHVEMMGVHPDFRGRGIGRLVLDAALAAEVEERGDVGVGLEVDGANTAARRLYANLGFKDTAAKEWMELRL